MLHSEIPVVILLQQFLELLDALPIIVAELMAIRAGLSRAFNLHYENVVLYSDSQGLCLTLTGTGTSRRGRSFKDYVVCC